MAKYKLIEQPFTTFFVDDKIRMENGIVCWADDTYLSITDGKVTYNISIYSNWVMERKSIVPMPMAKDTKRLF